MNIRTCCAQHANVDAQDEQMQMDELGRVEWLTENGHVDYHYGCPVGDKFTTETLFVLGENNGSPALFVRDESGQRGKFAQTISHCPGCGQKLITEDSSGIPNHWA